MQRTYTDEERFCDEAGIARAEAEAEEPYDNHDARIANSFLESAEKGFWGEVTRERAEELLGELGFDY